MSVWTRPLMGALAVLALGAAGCGGSGTVRVSGKVTFKGQPVPAGKIYFIPDGSKGNTGTAGFATIIDGQYDTGSKDGQGVTPGAVKVAIEGFDPNAAPDKPKPGTNVPESEQPTVKLLFSRYEVAADIPATTTKDFDVPAVAAKGPKEPKPAPGFIQP